MGTGGSLILGNISFGGGEGEEKKPKLAVILQNKICRYLTLVLT
jgi:hypothetical protein